MRRRLEKDLGKMSELAKDVRKQEAEDEVVETSGGDQAESMKKEREDLDAAVRWTLDKAAKTQGTDRDVQKDVFRIQLAKQEVMDRLKSRLKAIDTGAEFAEEDGEPKAAAYKAKNEVFRYRDGKGIERSTSFPKLVTDLEWGTVYELGDEAPKHLRKKYELAKAKHELQGMLDEQIITTESQSRDVHEFKREAYSRMQEDKEAGKYEKMSGLVAERMVKNFFTKIAMLEDMPFDIRQADVYQDVEQKIDFIIQRKGHRRGVGADAVEKPSDMGIQFTINMDKVAAKEEQLKKARKQMDRNSPVDDIMLVAIPIDTVQQMMRSWEADGKPSGGPEQYLDRFTAQKLFKGVLSGVLEQDEIAEAWAKVGNRNKKKGGNAAGPEMKKAA